MWLPLAAALLSSTRMGRMGVTRRAAQTGAIRCAATRAGKLQQRAQETEFVGSFNDWRKMPNSPAPEIALFGRSNVGKSSALNCLIGRRKKIARVSKTPGCTTALNLYRVGSVCTICDLPGYGYAKRGAELQAEWARSISKYVAERPELRACVVFLDPRHGPKDSDANFFEWLRSLEVPEDRLIAVATKVDTMPPARVDAALDELAAAYGLLERPIAFSSSTGAGRDQLWRTMEGAALSR